MIYPNTPLYLLSLLGYIYYLTYYTLTTKDNIILCSFVFILYTLKIDANELFWGTDTHTSESQQLDNQIALYAKQLSIDKKHIVLNLMDDLKNLN